MTRDEAARRFHLMPERIGELVVLGDKDTVFGETETEVETLPPTLSHAWLAARDRDPHDHLQRIRHPPARGSASL